MIALQQQEHLLQEQITSHHVFIFFMPHLEDVLTALFAILAAKMNWSVFAPLWLQSGGPQHDVAEEDRLRRRVRLMGPATGAGIWGPSLQLLGFSHACCIYWQSCGTLGN